MLQSILNAMDDVGQRLVDFETSTIGELQRVSFSIAVTTRQHQRLHAELGTRPDITKLLTFRDPEDD
jgi:hypothetical protein